MAHELVDQYVAYLGVKKGRPRSKAHIANVQLRLDRMLEGVQKIEELTPDRIEARLAELLSEEVVIGRTRRRRSTQTIDHHRRELGTFFRWLIRKRRLIEKNPIDLVDSLESEDTRRVTRPFSSDEAQKFFAVVSRRRVVLYAVWATCGLRPGESGRLLIKHVVLKPVDGSPPYIQVLRGTSKNRRAIRQPIHSETARMLAPLVEQRDPEQKLFRWVADWETFRDDLQRAGLPPTSSEGSLTRTSLRKLFATGLGRANVSLQLAQKLMRHSTPELTANVYTRFDLVEKAAAVERLPFLGSTPAA